MQKISLQDIHRIYFVGIGGTSMSGLAMMSLLKGFYVSGSDMRPCVYTEKLEEAGITVHIGHDANNVPAESDLVVYSAAINQQNAELVRARELGVPTLERSYFLGLISEYYPKTIAVSGTHGKTTTSSLVSLMLYRAGVDPSISIGGTLPQIGGNSRVGNSEYFVIEACEFIDSFLHSRHSMGVILNIEEDHLDYFTGGIEQIIGSFSKFAHIIPDEGLLIANADDPNVLRVIETSTCRVETFGFGEGRDWRAVNITYDKFGKPTFDVLFKGAPYATFSLNIPGAHNVMNSLSVIALGHELGVDVDVVHSVFEEFKGAKRRFEFRGEELGVKVFEDYAHHPTELRVTIEACKNYEHKKLWVVFQPHTYSRTYFLFDGFVDAVGSADEVIFNDIYSDREPNNWNVFSEDLCEKVIERHHVPTRVITEFSDIVDYVCAHAESGDIVLVAGSQSINQVAYDLIEALKRKTENAS
jgi:UDP-N-acetylmuramate--alanine ligase